MRERDFNRRLKYEHVTRLKMHTIPFSLEDKINVCPGQEKAHQRDRSRQNLNLFIVKALPGKFPWLQNLTAELFCIFVLSNIFQKALYCD